jgi:hypothetical protein
MFDFVGLDELTEQEKHELRKDQVGSYMTLNEIRRAEDLPDVEDGDVVLNPTYIQARQVASQERQAQQSQDNQPAPAAPQQPNAQPDQTEEAEAEDKPSYADNFTKSIKLSSGSRFLEVDLDDFITARRDD